MCGFSLTQEKINYSVDSLFFFPARETEKIGSDKKEKMKRKAKKNRMTD